MNPEYVSTRLISVNTEGPRRFDEILVFSTKESESDIGSLKLIINGWQFVPDSEKTVFYDSNHLTTISNRIKQLNEKLRRKETKKNNKASSRS